MLRHSFVLLSPLRFTFVRNYKKIRPHSVSPGTTVGRRRNYDIEDLRKTAVNEIDNSEYFDEEISATAFNERNDRKDRDDPSFRRQAAFHTIRRKYFKTPPEKSLLTWAAKEQIRYLHQMDPEKWTPERLAESFPVSVIGVKKLLKNNYVPQDETKMKIHDEDVLNNWKQLLGGGSERSSGPIPEAVKLFNTPQPFSPYINKNLPAPPVIRTGEMTAIKRPAGQKPGKFSSILQSYNTLKAKKDGTSEVNVIKEENRPESYIRKDRYDDEDDTLSATRMTGKGRIRGPHVLANQVMDFKTKQMVMKQKSAEDEEMDREFMRWAENQKKIQSASRNVQNDSKKDVIEKRKQENAEFLPGRKYAQELEQLRVTWDSPRDGTEDEAYMYDPKLGYQRPFGRVPDHPEQISIPEGSRMNGKLYQRGDAFYDEDGEFLYRVPGLTNE